MISCKAHIFFQIQEDHREYTCFCKLIFEPQNVDNASPATVSRNGMVYMSSSGLDWNPLFASWVKKKKVPPEDAGKVRRLFEENFTEMAI